MDVAADGGSGTSGRPQYYQNPPAIRKKTAPRRNRIRKLRRFPVSGRMGGAMRSSLPEPRRTCGNSTRTPGGRRRSHLAATLGCLAVLLLPVPLFARGKDARKPVRIAYQEFNRQMMVDENNRPTSGYAHDYIEAIGTYAGWEVRYVPCDSFADSVRMILAGEADLIYEISYTEERAKLVLFPDEPMGHEYYYLYASANNASIVPDDYSTLTGRTVGVTSGTIMIDLLKQWSEKKNVNFRIVEYEDISEKEADLLAGKIDLDLELSMLAKHSLSPVEKVGSSAYYLVAKKDRPDLVDDINFAMERVLNNDPFFFSRLQELYFSDTVLSRNLTREERDWLSEHRVLRVGLFDDYLPFSARDEDGRPIGAGVEAIREIVRCLKLENELTVEFVCYDNQKEGYRAVESGAIDVMFPAYLGNSVKQNYNLLGSKVIATLSSDLAFLDDHGEGKDRRLGVNRNNLMQYYYCKDSYPQSELVLYDDIEGCLDGLLEGTSDGTLLNGLRTQALLNPGKYRSIRTVRARNDFQFRMAFGGGDIGLMMLMDRGLTLLDPDFINKATYSYAERMYTFSLRDFLGRHILSVTLAFAVLAAMLTALIGYRISNRKLSGINRELTRYSETVEKQREQLEKKQAELADALHLAQSASRAKTTFLSNMSHDIRTPMNAILGFTKLAENHAADPERVKEYLEIIDRSSEHLLSLINDILDMSRIESGKMTIREKPESLAAILHALRDLVDADVREKNHAFSIDASGVKDDFVHCDKLRLNQMLLNLVSNAIKYTRPGGTISLRVSQKESAKPGCGAFEFRCKDNGIGMSEEFARTIFEPFTREESSTVSRTQGTGLGMAITKNIVDRMGGTISVSSKKGEGTEFVVTVDFRLADGPSAAQTGGGERFASLKGKKVLLVDDCELNLTIGALQLRDQGLVVETAPSGRAAVDRIREKGADAYDYVLMDVQMPEMDGYEATARIRNLPGGDRMRIIAYSANAFEEDKEKSLKAGMNGHVAKPLVVGELMAELERLET